jgi:hypothetical protein
MRSIVLYLAALILLPTSLGCGSRSDVVRALPSPTPLPTTNEPATTWPNAPDEYLSNEGLKRAWQNFERNQKYRLARPSDRNLTPAAAARVQSNNPHQIVPILNWWGARGYRGANTNDFVIAIVVDPSRSDPKRYGLVVIAAVASEGAAYKPYWVLREEDLESYLISPASGSVYIECFHRDGTEQTKEIVWDRKSRGFRLV